MFGKLWDVTTPSELLKPFRAIDSDPIIISTAIDSNPIIMPTTIDRDPIIISKSL